MDAKTARHTPARPSARARAHQRGHRTAQTLLTSLLWYSSSACTGKQQPERCSFQVVEALSLLRDSIARHIAVSQGISLSLSLSLSIPLPLPLSHCLSLSLSLCTSLVRETSKMGPLIALAARRRRHPPSHARAWSRHDAIQKN